MVRAKLCSVILGCLCLSYTNAGRAATALQMRLAEDVLNAELDAAHAALWQAPPQAEITDITERLLQASVTPASCKQVLKTGQKRIVLFRYPSGKLMIKGYLAYAPAAAATSPVLFFLRGGTAEYGVGNPAHRLSCFGSYTVIGTSYRDGVSPGHDEYGGQDVDDVTNLVAYYPVLAKRFGLPLQAQRFMMGESRGGLQMFLALHRNPELQASFKAVLSLSGLLDFDPNVMAAERPDLVAMFQHEFGLNARNQSQWFESRNPLQHVAHLRRDLPVVIVQGERDIRVSTKAGKKMVQTLLAGGHRQVHYYELAGGDHGLANMEDEGASFLWKVLQAFL